MKFSTVVMTFLMATNVFANQPEIPFAESISNATRLDGQKHNFCGVVDVATRTTDSLLLLTIKGHDPIYVYVQDSASQSRLSSATLAKKVICVSGVAQKDQQTGATTILASNGALQVASDNSGAGIVCGRIDGYYKTNGGFQIRMAGRLDLDSGLRSDAVAAVKASESEFSSVYQKLVNQVSCLNIPQNGLFNSAAEFSSNSFVIHSN